MEQVAGLALAMLLQMCLAWHTQPHQSSPAFYVHLIGQISLLLAAFIPLDAYLYPPEKLKPLKCTLMLRVTAQHTLRSK